MNEFDLTDKNISETYSRLVQFDGDQTYDGLGNLISLGSSGPQGYQGPRGDIGYYGPQGDQGPQGFQGPRGDVGIYGPQGWQGPLPDTSTFATQDWVNTHKLSIESSSATGTVVDFLTDKVYGTLDAPETGNISSNTTDAKLGVTNIIIHNSPSEPVFSSEFKKLSGSSSYAINSINYIYCTYITNTEIIYSINQRS